VHGVVSLAADVDALVIDPAFAGTPTGELLLDTAKRCGFGPEWHPGSALALWEVPRAASDAPEAELMRWQLFCAGDRAHRLAERVVEHHGTAPRLDAACIGQAAVSVVGHPERWEDWGTAPEVLQHLKDLWRMLVAHGGPCVRTRATDSSSAARSAGNLQGSFAARDRPGWKVEVELLIALVQACRPPARWTSRAAAAF